MLIFLLLLQLTGSFGQDISVAREVIVSEIDKPKSVVILESQKSDVSNPNPALISGAAANPQISGSPPNPEPLLPPSDVEKVGEVAQAFGISLIEKLINQGKSFVAQNSLDKQAEYYDQINPSYSKLLRSLPAETFNSITGSYNSIQGSTGDDWLDLARRSGNLAVGPPILQSDTDRREGTARQGLTHLVSGLVPNARPDLAVTNELFNQFLPSLIDPKGASIPQNPQKNQSTLTADILTSLIPGVVSGLVALGQENEANARIKAEAHKIALSNLNADQLRILAAYIEKSGAKSIEEIPTETLQLMARAKAPKISLEPDNSIRRREEVSGNGVANTAAVADDSVKRRFNTIKLVRAGRLKPKEPSSELNDEEYLNSLRLVAEARKERYLQKQELKSQEKQLRSQLHSEIKLMPHTFEQTGADEGMELKIPEKPRTPVTTQDAIDRQLEELINKAESREMEEEAASADISDEHMAKIRQFLNANPSLKLLPRETLISMGQRFGVPKDKTAIILKEMNAGSDVTPELQSSAAQSMITSAFLAEGLNAFLPGLVNAARNPQTLGLPGVNGGIPGNPLPRDFNIQSDNFGVNFKGPQDQETQVLDSLSKGAASILELFANNQQQQPQNLPPRPRPPFPLAQGGSSQSLLDLFTGGSQSRSREPSDLELLKAQVAEFERENSDLLGRALAAQASSGRNGAGNAPYDPFTGGRRAAVLNPGYRSQYNPRDFLTQGKPHGIYMNSFRNIDNGDIRSLDLPFGIMNGNFGAKNVERVENSGSLSFPKDILGGDPLNADVHTIRKNSNFAIADFDIPSAQN